LKINLSFVFFLSVGFFLKQEK